MHIIMEAEEYEQSSLMLREVEMLHLPAVWNQHGMVQLFHAVLAHPDPHCCESFPGCLRMFHHGSSIHFIHVFGGEHGLGSWWRAHYQQHNSLVDIKPKKTPMHSFRCSHTPEQTWLIAP